MQIIKEDINRMRFAQYNIYINGGFNYENPKVAINCHLIGDCSNKEIIKILSQ